MVIVEVDRICSGITKNTTTPMPVKLPAEPRKTT